MSSNARCKPFTSSTLLHFHKSIPHLRHHMRSGYNAGRPKLGKTNGEDSETVRIQVKQTLVYRMHTTFLKQHPRHVRECGSTFKASLSAQESERSVSNIRPHEHLHFLAMAAKMLLLIVMVSAAAITIKGSPDHASFSVKILLHNMAQGEVTLMLLANAEPSQPNYITTRQWRIQGSGHPSDRSPPSRPSCT
jgi:hypothetical protein